MINNDVRVGNKLIGFRCLRCGDIYESGWGNICNRCRIEAKRHRELIEALKHNPK